MSTMRVDTIEEKTSGNGVKIPGHIIQVLDFTLGTQESYSVGGGSFSGYSGLQGVITPKFNTSKIMCMIDLDGVTFTADNTYGHWRLHRDDGSTNSYIKPFAWPLVWSSVDNSVATVSMTYTDSPASTSALTYKFRFYSSSGTSTFNINRDGSSYSKSTMHLLEIAQ